MSVILAYRTILLVILMSLVLVAGSAHAGEGATCNGVTATIVGTSGMDSEAGTPNADIATMRGSSDYFEGLRGDDLICGGDGNDRLFPGRGEDHVYAGPGKDVVNPRDKSGPDTLYGGTGRDLLPGTGGSDVIRGGAAADRLVAGSGRDRLYGWTGGDLLKAVRNDGAEDYLEGGPGHDTCHIRADDTTVRCEDIIVH